MLLSMSRKSCLGYQPRIASLVLYEKDPDVRHDCVEHGEIGCMTQTTKDKHMTDLVSRAMKEKKD